jgi:hypothetical protein
MTREEQTRRKKKTESVRKLAGQIHQLRRRVTKDMKSGDEKTRLTALAVALIDKTAERVGNEQSAKEGHVGVTGFKNGQVTVSGSTITIKYTGKSGVKQEKQVTDKLIAKLLKNCKGNCKGDSSPVLVTSEGFKIKAPQVNRYLKEFGVTAKDIRGYAANHLVVTALKNSKTPSDPDERKKQFKEVLKAVADKVGHQQATLKQHYLLPGVEEAYVKSGKVKNLKTANRVATLTERVVAEQQRRWAIACLELSLPRVIHNLMVLTGEEPREIEEIRVQVNDWDLPEGKVGSYRFPGQLQYGVLTISPSAFESAKWRYVVCHEAIHIVLGPKSNPHDEVFQEIAEVMGIPERFRD